MSKETDGRHPTSKSLPPNNQVNLRATAGKDFGIPKIARAVARQVERFVRPKGALLVPELDVLLQTSLRYRHGEIESETGR
jgi:hypothetical protein